MEKGKKQRSPNFSEQDCLLLCHLLGETSDKFNMTNYKVIKHRFTNGITSETKKNIWRGIEETFNATAAVPRTASVLEKKWENMSSKNKAIYSDYKRELSLTGGGPASKQLSLLTEAVMDVVGKESVSVAGAVGILFDSTMVSLQNTTCASLSPTPVFDVALDSFPAVTVEDIESVTPQTAVETSSKRSCHCCGSIDEELLELKKKKLRLQIKLMERQLQEE